MSLQTAIKEVIIWKKLILELGEANYIFMCDKALGSSLLHILHFLRFTNCKLVLDNACNVLDDRLIACGVLLAHILLNLNCLVVCLLDRFQVRNCAIPLLLVSCNSSELLELLRRRLF